MTICFVPPFIWSSSPTSPPSSAARLTNPAIKTFRSALRGSVCSCSAVPLDVWARTGLARGDRSIAGCRRGGGGARGFETAGGGALGVWGGGGPRGVDPGVGRGQGGGRGPVRRGG